MKSFRSKPRTFLLAVMILVIASSSAFASANIVVSNTDDPGEGFNDTTPASPVGGNTGTTVGQQRLIAFQYAASIWGATLTSGPTITINASWSSLTCTSNSGTLGSAGNTGSIWRDFAGSIPGHWYGNALTNALRNVDSNGVGPEISAQFNSRIGQSGCLDALSWYYGLDSNNNSNQINLVTVVLHEFAHGLGFQTFTNRTTGQQSGDSQAGFFPTIYDRFLLDTTAGKTWPQMTDSERVASAINTNNVVWNGPQVVSDNNVLSGGKDSSGRPMMHTPNPVVAGSSISHWSQLLFPNQLMEPSNNTDSHSVTVPTDLTFSLLRDLGWCSGCPQPPPPPPPPPAPANDNFASAQVVTGCSGSVTGTNVSATKENFEPAHSPDGDGGGGSVWYQWQPTTSGVVTIDTSGSNYDTVLAVYTGSSVGGLTVVLQTDGTPARSDDVQLGVILHSTVTFNAVAGTVYRIAVDGYDEDAGGARGNIKLNWSQSCVQSNTIQLSSNFYNVGESGGNLPVSVVRSTTMGTASVNYSTADTLTIDKTCQDFLGIASSRCDYATTVGTLNFADGESSKTIFIPLVNDAYAEGNESFSVALSSPVGATLGSVASANITINDNETVNGANPLDGNPFFVRQQYIDFLGREPEPAGLDGWLNVLNNCGVTVAQPCDRIEVSAGFFRSPEFQSRGYFIYRFYSSVGAIPLYDQFMPDFAKVSGFLSDAQLEANKVAFINEFMARTVFQNKYSATFSNPTAYVDALLQTVGLPSHPSRTAWINHLTVSNTAERRGEVLRGLVESQQVYDKYYNEAFVIMQYFGYLRRTADASYLDWIKTMNQTGGDYRTMINGFMNSGEYRRRFGP